MDIPVHIKEVAENVIDNLLPQKSSSRYWKEYELFMNWCKTNGVNNYNEYVLLAYFEYRSKKLKSSTLWSIFSMLKSTLNIKHNINIEKYTKLIAFLKRTKDGYLPKKSKILEIEEIENFINNAPDEDYLMIKSALIIGMCAACRRHELTNLKIEDVQDRGDVLIINIADTKTKKPRSSCITQPLWIGIIRKYVSLRPPVGVHTFGSMPFKIASFLQLENPKEYTGHCFRRSSATVLAGHGADITTLKRHGGWKSTSVAEGYIEDSLKSKIAIANQLVGKQTSMPHTITNTDSALTNPDNALTNSDGTRTNFDGDSDGDIQHLVINSDNQQNLDLKMNDANLPTINIANCHNCTINLNFK